MTAFHYGLIFLAVILLLALADHVVGISAAEREAREMGEAVLDYELRRRTGMSRW